MAWIKSLWRFFRPELAIGLACGALLISGGWYFLHVDWNGSMHRSLAKATALRVRPVLRVLVSQPDVYYQTSNAAEVHELVAGIQIDPAKSGPDKMCCCIGQQALDFSADGKTIATFSFHHGVQLRWKDGKWRGDGVLTPQSGEFVRKWFASRGVLGPVEEYEHLQEQLLKLQARPAGG